MPVRRLVGCCAATLLLVVSLSAAGNSDVADAAMQANKESVLSLLQKKADVNAAQADGATALHWAVQRDDADMADLLIRAGANVKAATRDGATPLSLACINGNTLLIQKLLEAGADSNATMLQHGETALMLAARTGNGDAVKVLLDHGANVNAKETFAGTTPLMWATAEKHSAIVQMLVARGADVNTPSSIVVPPELPALISQMRIAGGTNPTIPVVKAPPPPPRVRAPRIPPEHPENDPNRTGGLTPLAFAARQGDLESGRILLAAGADVNKPTANGSSSVQVAVQNGHYEFAALLLDHGANPNIADMKGFTPLYLAIHFRNVEKLPTVPIWTADKLDALELIKKLLAAGANPNARVNAKSPGYATKPVTGWLSESGATPFLRASASGDLTVMRLLLGYGADPTLSTKNKTTPLMAAAGIGWQYGMTPSESESVEATKLLLELGADVNAANQQGQTALHGAAFKGSNATAQLLVDWGATMNVKDNGTGDSAEGLTPLDWAEFGARVNGASSEVPQPQTAALIRQLMTAAGIPIQYASECALRGFTCGDRDPHLEAK